MKANSCWGCPFNVVDEQTMEYLCRITGKRLVFMTTSSAWIPPLGFPEHCPLPVTVEQGAPQHIPPDDPA